jgi:hypothetical protein
MKKILILALILFLFTSSFVFAEFKIDNPLGPNGPVTFQELVNRLIEWVMMMAMVIAPLVIVIAGFNYATAGGDTQKIETAKRMLLYAAIGLGVVLLSKSLIESLQRFIELPSNT